MRKLLLTPIIFSVFINCNSPNIMEIRKEVVFDASPKKVWNILTNPELTKQYMFGCEVLSDWEIGSSILWKGTTKDGAEIIYVKGKILDIEKTKSVTFTMFDPNMGLEDIPENYLHLTYMLSKKEEKTVFTLIQGNFATIKDGKNRYKESLQGWEMVLPLIKKLIK